MREIRHLRCATQQPSSTILRGLMSVKTMTLTEDTKVVLYSLAESSFVGGSLCCLHNLFLLPALLYNSSFHVGSPFTDYQLIIDFHLFHLIMGFIKQTPTLSEEYSQPLIEDFIASSSDNNSNGRSSSTRDESDQRLNAPIEDVNAQELDLRQKVSRSHQRILRLRIISLLTTIVSAIGFLRRGNAGSLLKISPDVHQSKIQPSTTPLMMFGWTAILSGLIQLVCVILHVSGPWSRACHIRGISKVLVAIDRSILEPINPTDMEQVSQVSVAKALPVVIWLRLLLCDILVTNILVLSLVAINQLEEAEGYVGMNIFGILNRILAM